MCSFLDVTERRGANDVIDRRKRGGSDPDGGGGVRGLRSVRHTGSVACVLQVIYLFIYLLND